MFRPFINLRRYKLKLKLKGLVHRYGVDTLNLYGQSISPTTYTLNFFKRFFIWVGPAHMYLLDLRQYVALSLDHESCIMHLSTTRKEMTKKTYSVKAYYKDFFFYEVEAESAAEAKEIALANQEDWEKPDENWLELAGNAPSISSVKEV